MILSSDLSKIKFLNNLTNNNKEKQIQEDNEKDKDRGRSSSYNNKKSAKGNLQSNISTSKNIETNSNLNKRKNFKKNKNLTLKRNYFCRNLNLNMAILQHGKRV